MNELTKSEAHAVAELIDLNLMDTIRNDTEIDSMLWLRRIVHAFEKLCKYSGYNSGYVDEEEADNDCELTPVPCGCGGEAEAITAWNRAMGERKKGKWEVQPSTGDDRPFIWWKCSVCGQVIFSETERDRREFHAFCGRCGADMRGEHE